VVLCDGWTALQRRVLDESLSLYLQALVSDFKHRVFLPTLFPPNDLQLEELNSLVRLVNVNSLLLCITGGILKVLFSTISAEWFTATDVPSPGKKFVAHRSFWLIP